MNSLMTQIPTRLTACLFCMIIFALPQAEPRAMEAVEQTAVKEETRPNSYKRPHVIAASYQADTRIPANLGMSLFRLTEDGFNAFLGPGLKGEFGNFVVTSWNILFSYFFTLWPHEFGHWMRANEIGIEFVFHDFNPFLPTTTMEIPDGRVLTNEEAALASVAGFEVNTLIARSTEMEFYTKRYGYTSDLIHGWINEIFFPIYAFLVFPQDPETATTWENTMGDPVHSVLPVFKRYYNRDPVNTDGEVDPELISLYYTTIILSAVMPFTDPFVYRAIIENSKNKTPLKMKATTPWILLGNEDFGWTYGTHLHPGPLGYEIFMTNYIFISKKLLALTIKAGGPFTNYSISVRLPEILKTSGFYLTPYMEFWEQGPTGFGGNIGTEIGFILPGENLGFWLDPAYKTEGYSVGLPRSEGFYMLFGITIYFSPKHVLPM